jgi:hypothetical protein
VHIFPPYQSLTFLLQISDWVPVEERKVFRYFSQSLQANCCRPPPDILCSLLFQGFIFAVGSTLLNNLECSILLKQLRVIRPYEVMLLRHVLASRLLVCIHAIERPPDFLDELMNDVYATGVTARLLCVRVPTAHSVRDDILYFA